MFKIQSKIDIWISIAMIFIVVSIICLTIPLFCSMCILCLDWYLGVSITTATLSGAILVFKTISIQIETLQEEKRKNIIQRFDSQFFAILSQWRNDALQVKFTTKYLDIKHNGRTNHLEAIGENAFSVAKSTLKTIYNTISNKKAINFDYEVYIDEIKQEELKFEYISENKDEDEYNKVEHNIFLIIEQYQGPFLCSLFEILYTEYSNIKEDQILKKCILDKILEKQDISFNKYIKTLLFLTTLIKEMPKESDRYLNHIKCLLGKEENEFLKYCNLNNF